MQRLSFDTIIQQYPIPKTNNCRSEISQILATHKIKIIILDDDPTGIQTVHSCILVTQWDKQTLSEALIDSNPFFYILTNSRSLNPANAEKVTREVVHNIIAANKTHNFRLIFISRSDSTLRGHFPLEPLAICSEAEKNGLKFTYPIYFVPRQVACDHLVLVAI